MAAVWRAISSSSSVGMTRRAIDRAIGGHDLVAALVAHRIEHDAEGVEPVAESGPHHRLVLADAAGEGDRVGTPPSAAR